MFSLQSRTDNVETWTLEDGYEDVYHELVLTDDKWQEQTDGQLCEIDEDFAAKFTKARDAAYAVDRYETEATRDRYLAFQQLGLPDVGKVIGGMMLGMQWGPREEFDWYL